MIEPARILVVDDERSVREMIGILLRREGHDVLTANSGDRATEIIEAGERFDLVITDLAMDRGSGMLVLEQVKSRDPNCPVIMITAFGTTDTAVEAMKKGAHDYIAKPFNVDEFKLIVDHALEHRTLVRENQDLKDRVRGKYRFADIIGRSEAMLNVIALCRKVADSTASVLISGESGVGKEVVARSIHFGGPRSQESFVAVNCGALPEQLMESEMFGHVKGAFTGASADKKGLFQEADGGTIFLDEIGELQPPLQVKLLRVLQEKTIRPVGASNEHPVDVRVVSATNQDLDQLVERNAFRTDLYYRLNVIRIAVPPLRERKEDIPELVSHFLRTIPSEVGSPVRGIDPSALKPLLNHHYPGNVRELKNVLERAATLASGDEIVRADLPDDFSVADHTPGKLISVFPEKGVDLDDKLGRLEQRLIEQAMERTGGVQKQAAKLLGISVRSLRYRLDRSTDSDSE